ncbi:MAG: CcmD family protein [Deinococcales bacterium]|nr:CcmD family protein [Chitinophagaceae bacterium]
MDKLKRIGAIVAISFVSFYANAQTVTTQTDIMRSNGKIFVVMAVIIIIMIGFFIYLISVDRKLSKLEKDL